MALHQPQHEAERDDGDDRHRREAEVIHGHRDDDGRHHRRVDDPRHAAPREELAEGLDVGRDPGDERPPVLLGVVRQRQLVDVEERPGPQAVESALARPGQAQAGGPRCDRGEHHDRGADAREHGDEPDADVALGQAAVDHLLREDRRGDPSGRAHEGEQDGDHRAVAELGARLDPPLEHRHGAFEGLLPRRLARARAAELGLGLDREDPVLVLGDVEVEAHDARSARSSS
jgi:hypothetical protein